MKSLSILFILVFAFTVFGQKKKVAVKPKIKNVLTTPNIKVQKSLAIIDFDISSSPYASKLWTHYDKFDNKSTVYCKADSTLFFSFSFTGKILTEKPKTFLIRADDGNGSKGFVRNQKLQIIADSQRIELTGYYDFRYDKDSGGSREVLFFVIDSVKLEKIINAEKVDYRVGSYESYLVESEKGAIKNLLSLATPY